MKKTVKKEVFNLILKFILYFSLLTAGSIGLGLLLINNSFINNIDGNLYSLINLSPRIKIYEILITPFNYNFLNFGDSRPTYYYFMVFGFLLYLLLFKRKLLGWGFLAIILGSVIAYIVTAIDWQLVFRQRPYDYWPNQVDEFGKHAWRSWSSYPSGHVRENTFYSLIITHFIPKLKIFGIIFILFIGYSRIYIGAHYPFDVFAGILLGYGIYKLTLFTIDKIRNILKIKNESQVSS